MALGKKTGGKDWKPGEAPKSPGRPPLPKEILAARRLDKDAFERILHEFMHMTKEQIQERLKRADTPMIELMVGSVFVKSVQAGDPHRFQFLLERLLGRAPLRVEHTGADGGPIRTRNEQDMSDEELEAEVSRLRALDGPQGD